MYRVDIALEEVLNEMSGFAISIHPHTIYTSKPVEEISFVGHSYPHFARIRQELEISLSQYPSLSVRQADYDDYLTVHAPTYVDKLNQMASDNPPLELPRLSVECRGLEHCLPGYLYGLGGMLEAIDQFRRGNIDRVYCFSLGGHHAHIDWGHGYCILNPQAAAAKYAQARGFERVLIVDWDIHHGDGTQEIFANDTTVYQISLHSLADLYMSLKGGLRQGTTKKAEELGHCNIPILHQDYGDDFLEEMHLPGKYYRGAESIATFQDVLEELPWEPDLIMVHSGYDGHQDDCGKNITDWTNDDFAKMTRLIIEAAKKACCPILSVHGGGYNLPVTVSAAISHVEVLANL